jgi:hypothetical protein
VSINLFQNDAIKDSHPAFFVQLLPVVAPNPLQRRCGATKDPIKWKVSLLHILQTYSFQIRASLPYSMQSLTSVLGMQTHLIDDTPFTIFTWDTFLLDIFYFPECKHLAVSTKLHIFQHQSPNPVVHAQPQVPVLFNSNRGSIIADKGMSVQFTILYNSPDAFETDPPCCTLHFDAQVSEIENSVAPSWHLELSISTKFTAFNEVGSLLSNSSLQHTWSKDIKGSNYSWSIPFRFGQHGMTRTGLHFAQVKLTYTGTEDRPPALRVDYGIAKMQSPDPKSNLENHQRLSTQTLDLSMLTYIPHSWEDVNQECVGKGVGLPLVRDSTEARNMRQLFLLDEHHMLPSQTKLPVSSPAIVFIGLRRKVRYYWENCFCSQA